MTDHGMGHTRLASLLRAGFVVSDADFESAAHDGDNLAPTVNGWGNG